MSSTSSDTTKQRFGESVKFLPVLFVVCNILGLYLIYMLYHVLPKLANPPAPADIKFDLSQPLGIDFDEGLYVNGVQADKQADRLGVLQGWRAVAAGPMPVAMSQELFAKIDAARARGLPSFTIVFVAGSLGRARFRVMVETFIFNAITGLLVWCYVSCILVHPGTVPDKDEDPSWQYVPHDNKAGDAMVATPSLQETKRSGDRRHCKWCAKYKPDRCHHCRVCRMCILKMDHHCPWIYNCVGFNNHKYFFLLLFYATIDCHMITWTMLPSVRDSVNSNTPFMTMFLLLFGETLSAFIGVLVTAFFGFHIWLMMKAMTTIEFCEKSLKRTGYDSSVYDRGRFGNIQGVLGDEPLFWLLPGWTSPGRGLDFPSEDLDNSRSSKGSKHSKAYGATSMATKYRPDTYSPRPKSEDEEEADRTTRR